MLYSRHHGNLVYLSSSVTYFSGLLVFIQKVGVMRKYNSNLLNGLSSGVAGISTLLLASFVEGYDEIS